MKINCLSCGHKVALDDAYDDYAGEIKCYTCGANIHITAEEGKIRAVRLVRVEPPAEPPGEEVSAYGNQT
jgi:DNA-directed RNA polymerase subunit N (RpoN/RPB10)